MSDNFSEYPMVNCKNHGKEAVLLTGAALIHPYVGREIPCGKGEKKGRGAPLFWCDGVADEATRGACGGESGNCGTPRQKFQRKY